MLWLIFAFAVISVPLDRMPLVAICNHDRFPSCIVVLVIPCHARCLVVPRIRRHRRTRDNGWHLHDAPRSMVSPRGWSPSAPVVLRKWHTVAVTIVTVYMMGRRLRQNRDMGPTSAHWQASTYHAIPGATRAYAEGKVRWHRCLPSVPPCGSSEIRLPPSSYTKLHLCGTPSSYAFASNLGIQTAVSQQGLNPGFDSGPYASAASISESKVPMCLVFDLKVIFDSHLPPRT